MQLSEKHRPATWADVVGQDKAIKVLQGLAARSGGYGGRAYFISGASGTGKSTIARLIANEVADRWCIDEMDATELTPEKIRDIGQNIHQHGWGRGGKVYIVNEVHGLSKRAVLQLLCLLEPNRGGIPQHVAFVFTTTSDGMQLFEDQLDAHPLLSRCTCVALARRDLARAFAERVKQIAMSENLDGADIGQYVKLAQKHNNNCRAMLADVEAGTMMKE